MDEILALQYHRGIKRLQIIVLPYSFNISGAALIRFLNVRDETPDAVAGWRVVPIVGMAVTLRMEGLDDFEADIAMHEVFESAWLTTGSPLLEVKELIDVSSWDFSDLVGGRVPSELLTRLPLEVDNWS